MTRARSLSRLANTNALTVDASQNVGIGSTQPDVRLDVNGNMNVSGTLTYEDVTNVETAGVTTTGGLVVTGFGATIGGIATFFGDLNFGAAGVGGTITPLGHAEFAGVVTASSFSGDGSGLTGVASTDNINTSTLAQFTGGVGIADSIFHIGDDNTAIRFPAADTFTVETGGSERVRIDSSGNFGLGINSPDGRLHVQDTANDLQLRVGGTTAGRDPIIRLQGRNTADDTNVFADIKVDSDNQLLLLSDPGTTGGTIGQNPVAIDGSGRLLIGTTTEGQANADNLTIADSNNCGITIRSGSTSGGAIYFSDATSGNAEFDGYIEYSQNSRFMRFATAETERIRITSAGRVGIGTIEPDRLLVVAGSDPIIRSENTDSGNNYAEFKQVSGALYIDSRNDSSDGAIIFRGVGGGSATEKIRIGPAGQIGIAGANYGTSGQVLTSKGSGSAVAWEDASGGGGGITTQVGNASGIVTSMFLTDATDHKVTATGICTITTTQSGTEGQSHTIRIVNSGIATVGFSTYFLFPSAPVLPTADGAVSLISFTVHDSVGAGCTQLLAGASVNFS
jgi:hypothetical protein